jgi:hypothetical protein
MTDDGGASDATRSSLLLALTSPVMAALGSTIPLTSTSASSSTSLERRAAPSLICACTAVHVARSPPPFLLLFLHIPSSQGKTAARAQTRLRPSAMLQPG